ncbi:MAG TPA: AfsR/SARP family transcriptional regulator [Actinopolymorphaceae bacterium]|nr:AfsR/SARP family transcriptional regulator [Actinopolymorphaceae bacterium]
MRIRVLGTLEVQRGRQRRRITAGKQRALLATLAASAGQPVSIDRLVEELWPDGPVGTAVNQIHGYVWRLRTALDDTGGELIRTHAPGYELAVDTDDLDALRFTAVARSGTQALRGGDVERAHAFLTEALSLWRGPAYADVPATARIRAEVDRLDEHRISVLESRIDADLVLGRHADLVGELQALVEAEPFHERMWGQLMLALCRCGRQTEALAAYRRLYQRLDEQLGVRPNRAVQELHQQILEQGPHLDPPRVDGTTTTRPTGTGGPVRHGTARRVAATHVMVAARAARTLIPEPTAEVPSWPRRADRAAGPSVDSGSAAVDPRVLAAGLVELDALREEVLHLREEVRVLRRATAFFVETTR